MNQENLQQLDEWVNLYMCMCNFLLFLRRGQQSPGGRKVCVGIVANCSNHVSSSSKDFNNNES